MSSNPSKIVIQPKKKKKKKPLIIVSKKKSSVGAPDTQSQPPSPNTVVPTSSAFGSTNTTNNNNTKGGSKKKSNIIIKPYTKPPTLPTNFYDTSLNVLKTSLYCVLRHEKAVASLSSGNSDGVNSSANTGGTTDSSSNERLIGREELYRSVEDLCVHKLGTKLYFDIVTIINDSAAEIVQRLTIPSSGIGNGSEGSREVSLTAISENGIVGYNSTQLINELNLKDGGTTTNSNSNESSFTNKRYQLLQKLHAICRQSYAEEYITFVRSIFLALDRQFVYYSNVDLEEIGNGVEEKGKLKVDESAMDIDTPASSSEVNDTTTTKDSSSPPGGNVIERSSASSNNSRVWSLWEVGIACLRQQMVNCPTSQNDDTTLSVLTAMILTTTYAILSEYDNDNDINTANTQSSLMMDNSRPLIRNCVRTIIDLGSLPSLLEELIVVASTRFDKEGQSWQMKLTEGNKSASDFLLFVEHRLRQSGVLSGYYLPSNVESVNALRRLSQVDVLMGAVPSSSSSSSKKAVVSWSSANNSTRRLFPAIIEKQLLGPMLLTPNAGVLESRHLYPMLDDSDIVGGDMAWKSSTGGAGNKKTYENAKRLYGLCWRMTQSTASSAVSSPSQQSLAVGGNKHPPSALDLLRLAFGEYGRLRGGEIIKQGLTSAGATSSNANTKELEKKIIPDLLAFKNHLAALHEVAFRKDDSFASMLRSILDDVLNGSTAGSSSMASDDNEGDGGRRIAELLAKHVDLRFKDTKASAASSSAGNSSSSNLLSDANEAFQAEILALFRHIHSKDVFEAFYKRDLAKRLLTGRAVSTDMERSFLSKLKAECGAGYTSKMEGMFKDMDLSREIMGNYSAYSAGADASIEPSSGGGKTPDMDVQVLTTGNWPTYPKYPSIILPPELLALRSKFEKYYDDKYQGRRIAWQYSLGNCIVKASFPKSAAPKELIVNVCQSLVLLCFKDGNGEDDQGLTLDDIMKRTGIDDKAEMERVLQSLSMGREGTRVLKKVDYDSPTQPASSSKTDGESPSKTKKKRVRRNVGPYDRFLFNSSFTSNQRRIRITNITMKETSEERKKTHAAVSKDRLYFIDAAVVRIMKARKTIDHRGLIGEVMAQLKFPVTAADIKKRVESLIEREYMERVESDRSKYKYLA